MAFPLQKSLSENAFNIVSDPAPSSCLTPAQVQRYRVRIEIALANVRRELNELRNLAEELKLGSSTMIDTLALKEKRLNAALVRIDIREFGWCCQCQDEMSLAHLEMEPEAPFCEVCQREISARRNAA
jgi:RNA polymerase-binding transcription factor DksA